MRIVRILTLLCFCLLVAQPTVAQTSGPRLGLYNVLSYGNPAYPPIRLGHFELSPGGNYQFFDNGGGSLGRGTYSVRSGGSLEWLSGPFKTDGWGGGFEASRGGKTHSIKLKRGTFGSNSTDS